LIEARKNEKFGDVVRPSNPARVEQAAKTVVAIDKLPVLVHDCHRDGNEMPEQGQPLTPADAQWIDVELHGATRSNACSAPVAKPSDPVERQARSTANVTRPRKAALTASSWSLAAAQRLTDGNVGRLVGGLAGFMVVVLRTILRALGVTGGAPIMRKELRVDSAVTLAPNCSKKQH
jgi:hypothetical protein